MRLALHALLALALLGALQHASACSCVQPNYTKLYCDAKFGELICLCLGVLRPFTFITLIYSITVLLHVQCSGRTVTPCSQSTLLIFFILVVAVSEIYSYAS